VRLESDSVGQPMAVKVYDHREAEEHDYVAHHLRNEARLAGKLAHGNIIAPRRAVHRKGRTELEMEYAPGGNLGEYMAARRGLSEPEARAIFAQIVEGVGYLHGKNIAHRDLKLENVVLDARGAAKICDFGAAREGADTITRSVQGTPAYMAPECHAGAPHKAAPADVWSLGVLLHTLLVHGKRPGTQFPFWGKSIAELKRNISGAQLQLPDGLSNDCRDLLTRMLRKNAAQRMTIEQVRSHPWLRVQKARPSTARATCEPPRAPRARRPSEHATAEQAQIIQSAVAARPTSARARVCGGDFQGTAGNTPASPQFKSRLASLMSSTTARQPAAAAAQARGAGGGGRGAARPQSAAPA